MAPPDVEPPPPADAPAPDASSPEAPPAPPADGGGVPLAISGMAAALALLLKRRDDLAPGAALSLESPPVVVFVPGHGHPAAAEAFADLSDLMDVDEPDARYFDYRFAGDSPAPELASQSVRVDDAATALNAYVGGVAAEGRPVYLVGFSKGGATVAELVADWDDGRFGRPDAVVGAALLDPPIASGAHGWLQSLGRRVGPIPDDGGYQPVQCRFLRFDCSDRRAGLGRASGVEVVVIRNPKAAVTSFGDLPPGLRVYDSPDAGPTPAGQLVRNPLGLPGRIAQAHESVLHDRAVAGCIVAEMRAGRCDLPRRQQATVIHSAKRIAKPRRPPPRKPLSPWH